MKRKNVIIVSIAVLLVAFIFFAGGGNRGKASYYADSLHGRPTASGEPYDKNALTAAHRKFDFGTEVRVTYLATGKSVVVEINDRGPHTDNRIIDLSKAAAQKIGLAEDGVGIVELEVID